MSSRAAKVAEPALTDAEQLASLKGGVREASGERRRELLDKARAIIDREHGDGHRPALAYQDFVFACLTG